MIKTFVDAVTDGPVTLTVRFWSGRTLSYTATRNGDTGTGTGTGTVV